MLKYLAAFAIADIAGNRSKENVLAILKAAGPVDAAEFELAWAAFDGKTMNGLVAEGATKLSAAPAGGAAPAAAPAGGAAPAAAAASKKTAQEEEDEDDMAMNDLFD